MANGHGVIIQSGPTVHGLQVMVLGPFLLDTILNIQLIYPADISLHNVGCVLEFCFYLQANQMMNIKNMLHLILTNWEGGTMKILLLRKSLYVNTQVRISFLTCKFEYLVNHYFVLCVLGTVIATPPQQGKSKSYHLWCFLCLLNTRY